MTRRKDAGADDATAAVPTAKPSHAMRIESDLTIYTVAEWKEALLRALERSPELAVDLSDVSELDTAGLQLLLLASREARQTGKTLTWVAPSNAVSQVVALCNVDAQLQPHPAQPAGAGG